MMEEKRKKVLDALEAQCAKREYCTADIRRKALERLDYDAAAAEEVVSALLEGGFVDDRRYASAYAREKSSLSGWGPVKIRTTLLARGVDRDAVLAALGEIDPERAAAKLEKVLEAKWKTLSDDPQGRLKLIRFALSRGYDYEPVKPLVERITRPSGDAE
ncbi:MAG: RecX family transcriptional regulator [Bacteroidales bacterium]|nr:RecX family transcriptional regulator [Bacteroidales bacterium]